MEYTYKPTVNAIQYTGSIDAVIEFLGDKVRDIAWNRSDPSIRILLENDAWGLTLKPNGYLVEETFDDGKIEYKTMDEDEFNRCYRRYGVEKVNNAIANGDPKSLDQAGCDTTESAADTTPCEDKPEQSGRVDYSENYYFVGSFGEISCTSDLDTYVDIARYKFGNYFHTEKEAEQAHDEWLLQLKYRKWRKQHDPVTVDWGNENQEKWDITYDYNILKPWHFRHDACDTCGAFYFSTEQLAEQFYAEHKDLIHRALGEL